MRDKDKPWLPQESREYSSVDEMSADDFAEMYKKHDRNRNVIRPRDDVYRGDYGGVEDVKEKPFVQGQVWRRLQRR